MAKKQLSELEQPAKDYEGLIVMEKRIVFFNGNTVPLINIAQVMNRIIPYRIRIRLLALVFCILLAIASVAAIVEAQEPLLGIITAVLLIIIGYAIWERRQSPSYGLVLELVSGTTYYFLSRQQEFIQGTYEAFGTAIQQGLDFTANFENLNYTVMKGKYVGIHGSTIVDGDNIGKIEGGIYNAEAAGGDTAPPEVIQKVQAFLDVCNNTEATAHWNYFVAELEAHKPDKMKLELLLEKVNNLLITQKMNVQIQQQLMALIDSAAK